MIYDSNTYSIAATVLRYGGVPKLIGIARDNLESMNACLSGGLDSDMLVTSAGVSKGDYDMVKGCPLSARRDRLLVGAHAAGQATRFRHPRCTREAETCPLLGLPGNPVSARCRLRAIRQGCNPAYAWQAGHAQTHRRRLSLTSRFTTEMSRRVYARAVIRRENGAYRASLTGDQGSNLLTSMTRANGLAICPEEISPSSRPAKPSRYRCWTGPRKLSSELAHLNSLFLRELACGVSFSLKGTEFALTPRQLMQFSACNAIIS